MRINLPRQWRKRLVSLPESGMGYQEVRVRLLNGRVLDRLVALFSKIGSSRRDGFSTSAPRSLRKIWLRAIDKGKSQTSICRGRERPGSSSSVPVRFINTVVEWRNFTLGQNLKNILSGHHVCVHDEIAPVVTRAQHEHTCASQPRYCSPNEPRCLVACRY